MKPETPYYVIHKNELDSQFESLERAVKRFWSNSIIGYSYKTNALPWLIRHFNNLGCFAEVVSPSEYELARLIGVEDSRVIYNGPVKTQESFYDALSKGCIVNVDSQREIEWIEQRPIPESHIGIRVNFDIEAMCPGHSQCGENGGRFGFSYETGALKKAIDRIKAAGSRVSGLHLHVSSKTRSVDVYRAIASVACEIATQYCLDLSFVDVGGGFFGGVPGKPAFDDYISVIANELSNCFSSEKTTLIVEPGISLVGAPISYVTTVVDTKRTNRSLFIVTDGSRTNVDPLMHKEAYDYSFEFSPEGNRETAVKQVICGFTCMEGDRLFVAADKPALMVGDRVIYRKVGAYTMCLTPLFISYFPDVYVEDNGVYSKVRSAWTAQEYAMGEELAEMGQRGL